MKAQLPGSSAREECAPPRVPTPQPPSDAAAFLRSAALSDPESVLKRMEGEGVTLRDVAAVRDSLEGAGVAALRDDIYERLFALLGVTSGADKLRLCAAMVRL